MKAQQNYEDISLLSTEFFHRGTYLARENSKHEKLILVQLRGRQLFPAIVTTRYIRSVRVLPFNYHESAQPF